jgi:hypothetical protein
MNFTRRLHRRATASATIAVVATLTIGSTVDAHSSAGTATTIRRSADGDRFDQAYVSTSPRWPEVHAPRSATGDGVVWTDSVAAAIYSTTAVAADVDKLICGT